MALSRSQIFARCVVLLGGRAAEESVFGASEVLHARFKRAHFVSTFVSTVFKPSAASCANKPHW